MTVLLCLASCGEVSRSAPEPLGGGESPATDEADKPEREVATPKTSPDVPPSLMLRVATFNILAGKRGLKGIVDVLENSGADIVALQEVDKKTRRSRRVDQPAEFASALDMESYFVPHRRYDGGEVGVLLLSRFPIKQPEVKRAANDATATLTATLDTDSGDLDILVVHFHPTDPTDERSVQAQMDRLRLSEASKAVLAATSRSGPTLVLGDFNALPSSQEYAMFDDHFTDACADQVIATWPTPVPLFRIDYAWASRHFEVRGCKTVQTDASDHFPLVVDLSLPG